MANKLDDQSTSPSRDKNDSGVQGRPADRPDGMQTRDWLVDLALDLIAERGYEGMSLQMVADAAEVTKAAVYYHFHTKAELLEAVLQRLFSDAPELPDAREIRSRRARLTWAAEQILQTLLRFRRVLAVINGDPVIRKHPTFLLLVEGTRARVLQVLYGEHPSAEELASFHLATCAVHTLPNLEHLSDEDLVTALRPALYRTLGIPARAHLTANAVGVD